MIYTLIFGTHFEQYKSHYFQYQMLSQVLTTLSLSQRSWHHINLHLSITSLENVEILTLIQQFLRNYKMYFSVIHLF